MAKSKKETGVLGVVEQTVIKDTIEVTETDLDTIERDALINAMENLKTQNEVITSRFIELNNTRAREKQESDDEIQNLIKETNKVINYLETRERNFINVLKALTVYASTDELLKKETENND